MTSCLFAALLAVTAGWENICAERTEFPATPAIWKADFTQKTNFVWELREGAQGTVVFESDGVRIKKTNADGYIVVKARPFAVEKGDGVRFSADHETLSADVDYSSGVLRYHGRKERLSLDKAERKNFWNGGLQTMRGMPCTAPGMTYRKYGQCHCEDDVLTPVIVVSGAPSESVWRNWFAEDLREADDAWCEWRNNIPFAERAGDRLPEAEFDANLAADRDHTAEIRRIDGVSRLLLDGEIVPASVYKGMHCEFDVGRDKGETFSGKPLDGSAVKLMVKAVRPGFHCDPDGGNVDVKSLAAQIKSAMRLAPNSLFLVAVSGQAPADFVKRSCPQEAWIDEKGLPVMGLGGSCMVGYLGSTKEQFDKGACMWPSPSSPTWRKWVNASIRALVAELKAQKLDRRVVGIHIYGYHDGQYSVPYTDHSTCAQAEYRRMLAEPGCLSTNYAFCCKQMAFRAQEEFVRTFKEAMGKPTIGVMWCESPLQGAKNASLDITSFVNSDAMDAIVCQPNYRERLPGFPTVSALPLDSLHLHGKMFWNEYDYRTYAPVKTGYTAPSLKSLGTSADFPMWQSVYRKVAGEAAATRMGYWFYDMSGGWFHTPAIAADIRHNVAEEAALARLKPSAWRPDLAVVVDEEQILQEGENPLLRITYADEYIYASSCRLWGTSGVPYARYLAEDALRKPEILAGKKMVILAFFRKIDARRAALLERLAGQGATLVFLSETGVRGGAAITGFEPELKSGHFGHRIVPAPGVTENVASLFHTYCQREVTRVIPLGARCTVKERPGLSVLARYADGNDVALAERRDADCRRIYVAEAGGLTPALINRFAREAGCYAPVDGTGLQIDMNGDFVSVHCLRPGTYSFKLPFACQVMNLKTYAYEPVASGALALTLTAGETCRFRLLADAAAARAWEAEAAELKKTANYPGESVADLYAAALTTEPPPDAMLLGAFTWRAPGRERRVALRHNDSFPLLGSTKMTLHEGGTIHARVFFAESSTPPGKPQVYDGICMKHDEFLLGRTQDELYFNLHLDGKWAVFGARPKIPTGRWVDVAVTVAKDEKGYDIRYYIDGAEVQKARVKPGARIAKALRRNLVIGTCWGTQWRFGGKMSALDIFERPLAPEEVRALAQTSPASSRLRLGWEFCITHGKTPKVETAKRLIAIAADLGYEEIHLFSKAAFRYEKHPEASRDRSPYTWADVRELDDFCAAKGIELVPYQASFSHMEPWLATPEYRSLAEAPEAGVKTRWKQPTRVPMGLCAVDPRALSFLEELWDELLPNFRSRKFNVGCDEFIEYDDGGRRSAAAIKARGALVVYTDYLRQMNEAIRRRNHTMMCWADIVLHNPEAVKLVPKDVVLLDWGYEATHPFDKECAILEKSGNRYWVCPGTSGWNSLVGRVANMKGNVSAAWREGGRHGAEGLLLTTWGDGGHPQPWLVELPGLVYAAACVREGRELSDDELARRLDRICGCRCGETLIRWGNLYRLCATKGVSNNSNLAILLRRRGRANSRPKGVTDEMIAAVCAERRAARQKLDLTGAPEWVRDDIRLMELLLDAFEWRARGDHDRVVRELAGPYAELWLKQNRPGGLETSLELNLMSCEPWAREKRWN